MANILITETFAKYLAGLIDADGSLSITASKKGIYFYPVMVFKIIQAETIDKNFRLMDYIFDTVKLGTLNYIPANGNKAALKEWKVRSMTELELLIPHIAKYLVIKGNHFRRSLEWYRSIRGKKYLQEELSWFRENLKQSREDTGPIKPKNYPSAAWLAGYADGDGCFYNGNRQKLFTISFWKNDRVAPELIQKAFGGHIYENLWKNNPDICQYRLTLGGKQLLNATGLKFIHYVLPHLRIKKHAAEMLLAIHQQRLSEKAPTGEAIV